jgi:hypothetical protein
VECERQFQFFPGEPSTANRHHRKASTAAQANPAQPATTVAVSECVLTYVTPTAAMTPFTTEGSGRPGSCGSWEAVMLSVTSLRSMAKPSRCLLRRPRDRLPSPGWSRASSDCESRKPQRALTRLGLAEALQRYDVIDDIPE